MTLLEKAREIATGKPLRPEFPVEIQPGDLTPADPPQIVGMSYYLHPRWGVLRPRPELEPESGRDWPELPFIVEKRDEDGVRWARIYEIVDRATWQRLTRPNLRPATAPAPRQPVSALTGLWTYRGAPDVFIAGPSEAVDLLDATSVEYAANHRGQRDHRRVPGKPRASTASEMISRLEQKQISLKLAPDGRLVAFAEKGRISDSEREALRRSSRLLAAHLSGKPLRCAWCPNQAVVLLEPDGVEACPEHAA